MAKYWQVASGDSGRDYSSLFLNHDIMCIGPGRYGAYSRDLYDPVVERKEFTRAKISTVRQICEEVGDGDLVLLRNGHEVVGIGVVSGGYEHRKQFDDIHGWDLEHTRRVIWQEHLVQNLKDLQADGSGKLFGFMKQMTTFGKVGEGFGDVLQRVRPLESKFKKRALSNLPEDPPKPLSLKQFGESLFQKGIANSAVDRVLSAIKRQRRLLGWYESHGEASKRPDEQEVVAHMILPMLLALGWSEQLLAVQWQKIDLAAFDDTPTDEDSCIMVCEAKRMAHGMGNVLDQALRYVWTVPTPKCKQILLTQGGRFYLYKRPQSGWPPNNEEASLKPQGYINIEKIRTNHVEPAGTSAVDTIVALSPGGVYR